MWGHAVTRRMRWHGPVVDARGKRGGGDRFLSQIGLYLESAEHVGNRARLCQHLGRYCARTVNVPSGGDAMGTAVSSSRRAISLVREAYDRWASMSRSAPTSLGTWRRAQSNLSQMEALATSLCVTTGRRP